MADPIILEQIPLVIARDYLAKRLRLPLEADQMKELEQLIERARAVARPKVLYREAYLEERGEDWVTIGGERFESRILAVNLEQVGWVFPFAVTSGMEIEDWSEGLTDPLERSLVEGVKELALLSAISAFTEHLEQTFAPGKTAIMNPGSLEDWPLTEQRPLFRLLGDPEARLGIRLLESLMMSPSRTATGIRFPSETTYQNCMLCPRDDCPLRRAKYDPGLYERKYGPK